MSSPPNNETLSQALSRVWETDWRHRRSGPTLKAQATKALKSILTAIHGPDCVLEALECLACTTPCDEVGDRDIQQATAAWYAEGLAPATIQKRLNCLSKLGVNVEGCRVKVPKQLKWYLKETDKAQVLAWLRAQNRGLVYHLVAAFVEWTTLTGLRVEESLRLTFGDFSPVWDEVSVPGLKTATSQASLPLGFKAATVVSQFAALQGNNRPAPSTKVFNVKYELLAAIWDEVRKHFGWDKDPTATLKALRRSAARYLHVDCGMPLHMVQQYLRHESMDTTLEYLRLTGGYNTEEMRRYLK